VPGYYPVCRRSAGCVPDSGGSGAGAGECRAVLEGELGLRIHPDKTRIVHISQGFEFLGYKIGLGPGVAFQAGRYRLVRNTSATID
jgi:hypothetical protein